MAPQKGEAQAKLAIADQDTPTVSVYDARSGSNEPLATVSVHQSPVTAMRYNESHDVVISTDAKGAPLVKAFVYSATCCAALHAVPSTRAC
jgi:hypothetical protein